MPDHSCGAAKAEDASEAKANAANERSEDGVMA
jgi:hypothetical protein